MRGNIATFRASNGNGAPAGVPTHSMLGDLAGMAAYGGTQRALMQFRANSPLPRNAEEIIDNSISRVGRQNLVILSDLLDAGLTYPLADWLSVTNLTTQRAGESGRAQVGMTPDTRGERQKQDLAELTVPIYCVWDDWQWEARELATAQRIGYPLDSTMSEQATRNVNELLEDILLNGVTDGSDDLIKIYGNYTYGLLNAPNANTQAYEGGTAWNDPAKTGGGILADILAMMAKADAANFPGPYTLYIPTAYGFALSKEYTAGYPQTIVKRLLEIPGLTAIKVVPYLPANRTILMPLRTNVIDLVVGQLPAAYSWPTKPGNPFGGVTSMVLAVVIPRVKYDYNNKSGITLGYTS